MEESKVMAKQCRICGYHGSPETGARTRKIVCNMCKAALPSHIPLKQAKPYLLAYLAKYHHINPKYGKYGVIDRMSYKAILDIAFDNSHTLRFHVKHYTPPTMHNHVCISQ